MIVDCHTHISTPVGDSDVAEFLDACQKVDTCFVLTNGQLPSQKANKEVSEFVKQHKKAVGFAVINPLQDKVGPKSISSATVGLGLKGVVMYCCDNGFHPCHSRAMRLYEAVQELGLCVFFHNTAPFKSEAVLDYAQPYLLDEVARKFDSLKIIIGGMGMPFLEQTLCMLSKHENVFADLTVSPQKVWQVYNIVLNACEAGVMDKLLFGSGYPESRCDSCIETLLGFNKLLADTNLPNVPREKIRGIIERDCLELLGIDSQ